MAATYFADRLAELLAASVVALEVSRTGVAVPSRQYISHGRPAVDFCQTGILVVYGDAPSIQLRGPNPRQDIAEQAGQFMLMAIAEMFVEMWRCVPNLDDTGVAPTAAQLTASATQLAIDAHALWTGLVRAQTGGTLFPAGMSNVRAEFGDPTPIGPQGGMAGWRMKVRYPMSDLGPVL